MLFRYFVTAVGCQDWVISKASSSGMRRYFVIGLLGYFEFNLVSRLILENWISERPLPFTFYLFPFTLSTHPQVLVVWAKSELRTANREKRKANRERPRPRALGGANRATKKAPTIAEAFFTINTLPFIHFG